MRVLVSLRTRRDERGAIAVIVAVMATMLLVLGAMVIDFGQAYVAKNRAQEAADATALAAGKIYTNAQAYCDTGGVVRTKLPLPVDMNAQLTTVRNANQVGSTGTLTVECRADPTSVQTITITYAVDDDSPLGLGKYVTGTDHLSVHRHAVVQWGTSQKAVGSLRPWMICGAQVPTGSLPNPNVVEIGLPGNGHNPPPSGSCATDQPGNWWKTRCPGGGASDNDSVNAILNGCSAVTLAPTTPGNPNPGNELLHDCNTGYVTGVLPPPQNKYVDSSSCLVDDSGRDVKNKTVDAWKTLLGQTVAMPVFCDTPQCDPSSIPSGDPHTNKATWPVWKIAAVTICGYAMHGQYSPDTLPTGDCNNGAHGLKPTDFPSSDMGFLLIFKGLIQSGDTGTFPVETKTTLRLVE